nr:hypothetical protein BaRGS_015853 [Batillaria attramentaria]
MADQLSKMLSKKMDALWRLVHAAEEAAKNHTYNPFLEKSDVTYPNAKEMSEDDLEYNSHFQQKVNFNYSSVHIPVEIYDGEISILNGLNWTADLNEQFKKNYKQDPQMLWQFFGSQTGFMRTYPASRWNKRGSVDLFDVRRQSWYTQGSSSPKDMIILIDKSGSTHGQALQLMKNAVKSILDTLGENDFVNIVSFAQEAEFVSKCFNHTAFVQANYRNKKQLEKDVDELVAGGQAEYKVGLRFAFEKFEEFANSSRNREDNMGANCNKVIILLTDGGTDNAEEVFKEYNWPHKSVRVFTYAIGPTATPVAAIKWMACANRGYFSQIPAMGAIRARVQEYLEVLGRPLALAFIEHTEWTSSHKTPLAPDNSGLGMMTTVTLPVYNRTLESLNQTILGVMGIDVPTSELGRRTPYTKIGPNGYSFAINPNGYAVFHPNLKSTGRYMKDPPNIDLLELELQPDTSQSDAVEAKLTELRNQMIDGNTGRLEIMNTLFLSPDKKYASWSSASYTFTNITNTTFRLGLCVPEFQKQYPLFNATPLPDFRELQTDLKSAFMLAPWDYLGDQHEGLNNSIEALLRIMQSGNVKESDLSEEQIQLLQHLAGDVDVGLHLSNFFEDIRRNHPEITISFLGTNGGLTVVHPASEAEKFADLLDIRNATYYQRAIYAPGYVITPVLDPQNDSVALVMAVRSAAIHGEKYRVAVIGVQMDADKIRDVMTETVNNYSKITLSTDTYGCSDDEDVYCYLVDDGGFLVASNQDEDQVGTFLGELDPQVWNTMQNETATTPVFGRTVQHDFQAICKAKEETTSSGVRSFFVPSVTMLYDALTVNWWTSRVAWAFTSFNVYSWLFGPGGVFGQVLEAVDESYFDDGVSDEEEDCVMAYQQFYFRRDKPSNQTLDIECPATASMLTSCEREVRIVRLPQTNLMFIVAKPKCEECGALDTPVGQEPYRISDEEEKSLICSLSMHPRRRVVSYGCYDKDDNALTGQSAGQRCSSCLRCLAREALVKEGFDSFMALSNTTEEELRTV